MKGYFSFLLVLASVALILIYARVYSDTHALDFSELILLEKSHQDILNFKGAMIESIRTGGKSAFDDYSKTHTTAACLSPQTSKFCFKKDEAELAVRNGAYQSLIALSGYPTQYQKIIWCGVRPDRFDLDNAVQSMRLNHKPLPCTGCIDVFSCGSLINPKIIQNPAGDSYSLVSIILADPVNGLRFGVSIYDKENDIAVASYIPAPEVVEI